MWILSGHFVRDEYHFVANRQVVKPAFSLAEIEVWLDDAKVKRGGFTVESIIYESAKKGRGFLETIR
jgi:hypothetical protein